MKAWVGTIVSVFCVLMIAIGVMFAILQGTQEKVERLNNEIKGLRSQALHIEEELNGRTAKVQ